MVRLYRCPNQGGRQNSARQQYRHCRALNSHDFTFANRNLRRAFAPMRGTTARGPSDRREGCCNSSRKCRTPEEAESGPEPPSIYQDDRIYPECSTVGCGFEYGNLAVVFSGRQICVSMASHGSSEPLDSSLRRQRAVSLKMPSCSASPSQISHRLKRSIFLLWHRTESSLFP